MARSLQLLLLEGRDPLRVPDLEGIKYTHGAETPTKRSRIDLNSHWAWTNKRFWGYIGDITEGTSQNTETPYELIIVGRILLERI